MYFFYEWSSNLLGVLLHAKLSVTHDVQFDSLSDYHNVDQSCCKLVAFSVLQMSNFEASGMLLTVVQDTNSPNIVSTGNHAHVTVFELDEVLNLACFDIQADAIIDFRLWVWESNSATIMRNDVVHTLGSLFDVFHAAQFVSRLFLADLVHDEPTLSIVQETEMLLRLIQRNHVHESGWVGMIGLDFSVHLDQSLNHNSLGLLEVEGVFQAIAQQQNKRQALTLFVWTRTGLRSPHTCELIKHPVRWRSHALHMFLWTARHGVF